MSSAPAGVIELEGGRLLLLDKPAGMTSHDVVDRVRRVTGEKKVGHGGTLDPMATGLLIVGVGRAATRRLAEGLGGKKTYCATVRLGLASETLDRDSETVSVTVPGFDRARIERALQAIERAGQQTPPMISALKRHGIALMKLARRGWWIEREPRDVQIERLQLLGCEDEGQELELEVTGGGGLYIRTLADDLGAALGVPAALISLRRTAVSDYRVEDAITLDDVADLAGEKRE